LAPASAHYVKALGTLGAESLKSAAYQLPKRAVLLYATDDLLPGSSSDSSGQQGSSRCVLAACRMRYESSCPAARRVERRLLSVEEARAAVEHAAPSTSAAGQPGK
jgi:hypothetical protein